MVILIIGMLLSMNIQEGFTKSK